MPSNKTFRTKIKLAKAAKQNRPIPQWIRLRTDNTIKYNAKRRHWRRTKRESIEEYAGLHAILICTSQHLNCEYCSGWRARGILWSWSICIEGEDEHLLENRHLSYGRLCDRNVMRQSRISFLHINCKTQILSNSQQEICVSYTCP